MSFEVYNYNFNINTTNNKFELYTDTFDEFSFEELKDELEKILSISDITTYQLNHEKIGPRFIEAYRKLGLEKIMHCRVNFFITGLCSISISKF